MNKRQIYYLLSPYLRRLVRKIYYFPIDIIEGITGKRDKLTPPKGQVFIGSGDFIKQGDSLLNQLIKYGNLKPHHRVLDVGCGIGRLAVPLTKYISNKGSYEGFDIVKSGIKWCQKNISNKYNNFKFIHIDLKNDLYNLGTNKKAENFVFPYNDEEFNLAFLFSVFTHMIPEDVDNYLSQINRVLKKDEICFATFFILNEESKNNMNSHDGLKFNYNYGNYSLHDKNVKEANIAYNESFLKKMINKNNFKIENVYYGFWSSGIKKDNSSNFQDIVILRKV